jgi:hypothetical protein
LTSRLPQATGKLSPLPAGEGRVREFFVPVVVEPASWYDDDAMRDVFQPVPLPAPVRSADAQTAAMIMPGPRRFTAGAGY